MTHKPQGMKVPRDVPAEEWDRFVSTHSRAHVLQSAPWGDLKSAFGWEVQRVALDDAAGTPCTAGAQILYRRLPGRLIRWAYVPGGPVIDWEDAAAAPALVAALAGAARARGATVLTLEPDLPDEPRHRERLAALGFVPSPLGSVQPWRSIVVELAGSEDAILAAMKSKTRYNVRLAARKGVTVREGTEADLPAFYELMTTTAGRDQFGIHSRAYYERAFRLFVPRGWARVLLAEVEGEPVAALMTFALGERAWYFYGASGNAHREKMPNYLLQWEAMRWARSRGCVEYDLWGVPDDEEEALEAEFTQRSDGLWGVYRFKRGFGGQLVRTVGAWDLPLRPLLYRLYTLAARLRGFGG